MTGKNLFAYCDNNPVVRIDHGGECWEAIAIGFIAGVLGQYVGDVIGNINSGETGINILKPTSHISDYMASGAVGAIAAILGLKLVGTMAVGAIGNVVSDGLKGNISSLESIGKSAFRGAVANAVGYGAAKGMAKLKVKQIDNMSRNSRKAYLRDKIFCNSQADVNRNLQVFARSSLSIVENRLAVFRSGIYSTLTLTVLTLF